MGLVSANAQSNKYDLNEDGNVNITDVIELVNYILGLNNGNIQSIIRLFLNSFYCRPLSNLPEPLDMVYI